MKRVRITHLLPKKYPTLTVFEFSVLISPVADQEELCGEKQRPSRCKNGRKTSPPVRNHQLPTSRAPLPRTYHQGNHRAPGYLPGGPRHTEPRISRVPSLQRHWAERETLFRCVGDTFRMGPRELEEPEVSLSPLTQLLEVCFAHLCLLFPRELFKRSHLIFDHAQVTSEVRM